MLMAAIAGCNFPSITDSSATETDGPASSEQDPGPTSTITPTTEPTATATTTVPVEGYVILTDLDPGDDYYAAVEKLAAYRQAEVVTFGDDVAAVLPQLQALSPRYLAIVTRPERIEEGFTFEIFTLAKDIQPGFETDAAYGFITGITAEDAVAYVDNLALYERGLLPQNENFLILWRTQTGAVGGGLEGLGNETTQDALDTMTGLGFSSQRIDMDTITKPETLSSGAEAGLLFVFAHGMPYMIECGVNCTGDAIMAEDIPSFEATRFVVSTACYGGVAHTWYQQGLQNVASYTDRTQEIEPVESIALNFMRHGAIGYVGHLCMWGSYVYPLTGPQPITDSAVADIIGMDNNQFYYAAMILYGDPAVSIQLPSTSN
jgi:hypothetical protein